MKLLFLSFFLIKLSIASATVFNLYSYDIEGDTVDLNHENMRVKKCFSLIDSDAKCIAHILKKNKLSKLDSFEEKHYAVNNQNFVYQKGDKILISKTQKESSTWGLVQSLMFVPVSVLSGFLAYGLLDISASNAFYAALGIQASCSLFTVMMYHEKIHVTIKVLNF
jgi:hypothetical protein